MACGKTELHQLTLYAVGVCILDFGLMQTDDFKNRGAIIFRLASFLLR